MAKRIRKAQPEARRPKNLSDGQRTNRAHGKVILTHSIGAVPIINRLLGRMRLDDFLTRHLPPEDKRTKVETFEFDRIYGAWWGKVVTTDATAAVIRSAERYIRAIEQG